MSKTDLRYFLAQPVVYFRQEAGSETGLLLTDFQIAQFLDGPRLEQTCSRLDALTSAFPWELQVILHEQFLNR